MSAVFYGGLGDGVMRGGGVGGGGALPRLKKRIFQSHLLNSVEQWTGNNFQYLSFFPHNVLYHFYTVTAIKISFKKERFSSVQIDHHSGHPLARIQEMNFLFFKCGLLFNLQTLEEFLVNPALYLRLILDQNSPQPGPFTLPLCLENPYTTLVSLSLPSIHQRP